MFPLRKIEQFILLAQSSFMIASCVHLKSSEHHNQNSKIEKDGGSDSPELKDAIGNQYPKLLELAEALRLRLGIEMCQGNINSADYIISAYKVGFLSVYGGKYVYHVGQKLAADVFATKEFIPKISEDIVNSLNEVKSKLKESETRFIQRNVVNARNSCQEISGDFGFKAFNRGSFDAQANMFELFDTESCVRGFMSLQRVVVAKQNQELRKILQRGVDPMSTDTLARH